MAPFADLFDEMERASLIDCVPLDTSAIALETAIRCLCRAVKADQPPTRWLAAINLREAAEALDRAGLHELAEGCREDRAEPQVLLDAVCAVRERMP